MVAKANDNLLWWPKQTTTYYGGQSKRQLTLVAKDLVAFGTLELRLMVGVLVQPVSLHQVLSCEHAVTDIALGGETASLPVVTLEVGLERDLARAATATQAAPGNGIEQVMHRSTKFQAPPNAVDLL